MNYFKTLEYIPERDGPLGIGPIPNHITGSATGITPLVAREEYGLPRMEYPNTMGPMMDEIPRKVGFPELDIQFDWDRIPSGGAGMGGVLGGLGQSGGWPMAIGGLVGGAVDKMGGKDTSPWLRGLGGLAGALAGLFN